MTLAVLAFVLVSAAVVPNRVREPSAARLVPVNAMCYRMVNGANGTERIFTKVAETPNEIRSRDGWLGSRERQMTRVWKAPTSADAPIVEGRTYERGQLRAALSGGVNTIYPAGDPEFEDTLASLWPAELVRLTDKGSAGDIWQGPGSRVRLWFVNPNDCGLLGAELWLLGLALLLVRARWVKVLGLVTLAAGLYPLVGSGSRGALVGAAAGSLALGLSLGRRLFSRRVMLFGLAAVVLLVTVLGVSGRLARVTDTFGHVDKGNGLRLAVGRAAVEMFAAAPGGWRGGDFPARSACLNWYVDDQPRVIRTHLLTLTELGWPLGAAYCGFWLFMLGTGIALAKRGQGLPLALWSAFALAGFFNPVYRTPTLWALPVAASLVALRGNLRAIAWRWPVLGAAVAACLVVAALVGVGSRLARRRAVPIGVEGRATVVNGDTPAFWVVADAPVLGGWQGFPGREILLTYEAHPDWPAMGYVEDYRDLPEEVDNLVLPGRAAARYLEALAKGEKVCSARRILFLSPMVGPDAVPPALLAKADVEWRAGRFLALREESYVTPRAWVHIVPGTEQYLPGWMKSANAFFTENIQQNKEKSK